MKKSLFCLLLAMASVSLCAQSLKGNSYKGYVDFSFSPGNDGVYYEMNTLGFGITTSQGYQINPYIYVGAGLGVHLYSMDNFETSVALPIFANFRANFTKTKVSPFFDAKIGYSVVDLKGVYLSPSLGVRIGLSNNLGLNIKVGYSAQKFTYWAYKYSIKDSYIHSANISIGLDW